MLYFYVAVAYTVINVLLAGIIYAKSRKSLTSKFYVFCNLSLSLFGVSVFIIERHLLPGIASILGILSVFLFSLVPFFFLHFMVLFLRRYEILRSKSVLVAIYLAGLFSYAMVLIGYVPRPITAEGVLEPDAMIYYITWVSIFFSIGIALLYSLVTGFTERLAKSNFLLSGFGLLMLVLPSPFTESIFHLIFRQKMGVYGISSGLAMVVATYLIFRYKIMMTVYDSLRSALVVLNDILFITDATLTINVVRGGIARLGYDENDLVGKFLNNFIRQKFYIEHYLTYVRTGKMRECRFDADVVASSSEAILFDFSLSPIFENDQLTGFVGIARDITEQKREAALRQSEEKFRSLAEDAQDILYKFRFAPQRGFEYISPSAERITGYTVGEFYANPDLFSFIVNPAHRADMEECFKGTATIGKPLTVRITHKSGKNVYLEQRMTPVLDAKGVAVAMGVIARDVTERILLEDQLRQAQKLESVGTLAGGIAHDFNNILGIILGYSSQLSKEPLSDNARMYVATIQRAVERATTTVRQLLTIARKSETRFAALNPNACVEELIHVMESTFPKNIFLHLELQKDMPAVNADHNQIHQALLNLCVNARDAMPEGGAITLGTALLTTNEFAFLCRHMPVSPINDDYVRIRISDTGTGIPEDVQERIFEPFFTTKEIGKGTGLGLALVMGIIKAHHGCITVKSAPGKGTTFDIFLPVLRDTVPHELPASPAGETGSGGTETILVVEDEDTLLQLVTNILKEKGYTVETARTADEALSILTTRNGHINLLLTDMGLPGMDGWKLFQLVRQKRKDLPAIFASGYIEPAMNEEMSRQGAKYFVQKPYNPNEILSTVRQVLDDC